MTNRTLTQIADEEAVALAGVSESSSRSTAGPTAEILTFPSRTAAAPDAWEIEASSLDEDVFQIGELAVRLVGSFDLPRLVVFVAADPEGGEPDRLP